MIVSGKGLRPEGPEEEGRLLFFDPEFQVWGAEDLDVGCPVAICK